MLDDPRPLPVTFPLPQLVFPVWSGPLARYTARQLPGLYVFVWSPCTRSLDRRRVLRSRDVDRRWRFFGGRLYAWRYRAWL